MARSSAGVSALARAVAILESFDTGIRDLSLTEISERSGMPLSTTQRLLEELVSLGLLERIEPRRYRIGLRLWELAVRTPGALGIREIAMPALRAAHTVIGQHLQLGILDGDEVLHLERLSAPHATVNFSVVGGRMPFHSTSSGLVLAAFAPPAALDKLLRKPLPEYRIAPRPDPETFRRELAVIRRQGYATTVGYVDPAATAIGVPVFDHARNAIAAVTAIVPSDDPHEAQVLPVIRRAASAIARALGQRYGGGPSGGDD